MEPSSPPKGYAWSGLTTSTTVMGAVNTKKDPMRSTVDFGIGIPSLAPTPPIKQTSAQRENEFRILFNLSQENLMYDYGCALHKDKGVIAQGRMYISDHYVCFHSSYFGPIDKIMMFNDIRSITKKNTAYVFPNAIEIALDNEKLFFGSFILRDQAYNALTNMWAINKEKENQRPPAQSDAPSGRDDNNSDRSIKRRDSSSSGSSESNTEKAIENDNNAMRLDNQSDEKVPVQDKKDEKVEEKGKEEQLEFASPKENERTWNEETLPPFADTLTCPSPKHFLDDLQESDVLIKENLEFLIPSASGSDSVSADMKEFWSKFYAQNDCTLSLFRANGFEDIAISEWTLDPLKCCVSRSINFISPINSKIGPKKTRVVQTQRAKFLQVQGNESLCVDSVSASLDVPYADSFLVIARVLFTKRPPISSPDHLCLEMKCYSNVKWVKSGWGLKGIIEKSAIEGQRAYFQKFLATIKETPFYSKENGRNLDSSLDLRKSQTKLVENKTPGKRVKEVEPQPTPLIPTGSFEVIASETPSFFLPVLILLLLFLISFILWQNIKLESKLSDLAQTVHLLEQKNKALTQTVIHLTKQGKETTELSSMLGLLNLDNTKAELKGMLEFLDVSQELFRKTVPVDLQNLVLTPLITQPSLWDWALPSIVVLGIGSSWILIGIHYFSRLREFVF